MDESHYNFNKSVLVTNLFLCFPGSCDMGFHYKHLIWAKFRVRFLAIVVMLCNAPGLLITALKHSIFTHLLKTQ